MSYQSPIEVFYNDIECHFEDAVFKAIQKVDIKVDRNELIKALEYDRAQYDKGYSDGRFDKDREIVRCKDCKWFNDIGCAIGIVDDSDKPKDNDYCSFGERKDEAEHGQT